MNTLFVICGPAGAGKSTYGKRLAKELSVAFLDSDTVTEPVVRSGMKLGGLDPDDRDSAVYRKNFRDPVYECLYQVAAENLSHLSVVMVGPFTREIQNLGWPDELRKRFNCKVEFHFVSCDDEVRRERIKLRGNPRDSLKLKEWGAYLSSSSSAPPVFDHLIVSA